MKTFKEFQLGWPIFLLLIPFHVFILYTYVNKTGDHPIDVKDFILISAVFTMIYFLFFGMTTLVQSPTVKVYYGIGIIKKTIDLQRIRSVEIVKTPWYYGWGIRFIPKGMLYNISGSNAVELKFNDTNRIIRIGTKDAPTLKKEIEKRLTKIMP